jgi:hypothetical protein
VRENGGSRVVLCALVGDLVRFRGRSVLPGLRTVEKMEYIFAILREAINLQYIFQSLESAWPILTHPRWRPLRAGEILHLQGPKKSDFLQKSCAARAQKTFLHTKSENLFDFASRKTKVKTPPKSRTQSTVNTNTQLSDLQVQLH